MENHSFDKFADGVSYEDMVSDLEQNQIVLNFVNRINELKKTGKKSFGIMSIGYPELQHRVILASSSLLQRYNPNEKLGLVVNSRSVVMQKFIQNARIYNESYKDIDISHYDFYKKFDLTLMNQFTENYSLENEKNYIDLIDQYSSNRETILWDLPLISEIKNNYQLYFSILEKMNDVFLVLPSSGSSKEELNKIKEYFANFNIEIRGIMLQSKSKKSKSWWEFWK